MLCLSADLARRQAFARANYAYGAASDVLGLARPESHWLWPGLSRLWLDKGSSQAKSQPKPKANGLARPEPWLHIVSIYS